MKVDYGKQNNQYYRAPGFEEKHRKFYIFIPKSTPCSICYETICMLTFVNTIRIIFYSYLTFSLIRLCNAYLTDIIFVCLQNLFIQLLLEYY